MNTSDIRTGRHCVFDLHVHLVFVTSTSEGSSGGAPISIIKQYIEQQNSPE